MFCPKCGASNKDDADFCGSCGASLKRDASGDAASGGSSASKGTAAARSVASGIGGVANAAGAAAAKAKSKPWAKIAIPVIVVIVAIAIILFALDSCGGSGVTPKSSVNDYTWEELSKISGEIGRKTNENDAVNVAKKYNLVGSDGKLDGSQTKTVQLSGGSTATVQIAGFSHDDKTGGGKAGITFIFKDAIAKHEMNSSNTNSGGWEGSGMRSWLSSSGLSMLPQDLTNKIVAVDKKTNNTGETSSTSSVTTTSDKLWLFSFVELAGETELYEYYSGSDYAVYDDILNAEGTEYKLFRDCNVAADSSNGILQKKLNGSSHYWWERSPYPNGSDSFCGVYSGGGPYYGTYASTSHGVVPGFCL